MARDDTSTDSRYDSLSQRVSSLESRRDRSVDQAISPVSKRIDDLASELKDAQRNLRQLDAEFQKHRDKVRQQQTLIAGRREADSLTAAVEAELELIINILVSAVPSKRPTFDELLRHTEIPPFDPGRLGMPEPAPRWEDFAPPPPVVLFGKVVGARRQERQAEARRDFPGADGQSCDASPSASSPVRRKKLNWTRRFCPKAVLMVLTNS